MENSARILSQKSRGQDGRIPLESWSPLFRSLSCSEFPWSHISGLGGEGDGCPVVLSVGSVVSLAGF